MKYIIACALLSFSVIHPNDEYREGLTQALIHFHDAYLNQKITPNLDHTSQAVFSKALLKQAKQKIQQHSQNQISDERCLQWLRIMYSQYKAQNFNGCYYNDLQSHFDQAYTLVDNEFKSLQTNSPSSAVSAS